MLSINDYSFGIGISELMLSHPLWKAFRAIGMGITTTAAVMAPHEVLAIDFRFFDYNYGSAPIFVPVSQQPLNLTPTFIRSTPGPLPILGALALHHSSRRLRRRLRQGLKD